MGSRVTGTSPPTLRSWPVPWDPPAGGTAEATTSGAGDSGFRIGDDVVHGKWGEGVVLDLQGAGDKTEITVNFPAVGQKVLLLAWAPLKRA